MLRSDDLSWDRPATCFADMAACHTDRARFASPVGTREDAGRQPPWLPGVRLFGWCSGTPEPPPERSGPGAGRDWGVLDDAPHRLACSARGCRATAVWALQWNNPRLHPAERRT